MRKVLVVALGASLLTIIFASEASAQRWRGAGFYGGVWRGGAVWRGGGWGLGYRPAAWRAGGWGYRPWAWRAGGWGYRPWAYRRPLLWGAAAFGTAAALAYAASYPSYSYGYGYGYPYGYGYASYGYAPAYSYAYVPSYSYTGYSVPYYAYASCGTTSRLIWNGWAYRRVWIRTC